jgi:sugar O-acyltransferase (sialic acid O-acetyltransferase NeuD family)
MLRPVVVWGAGGHAKVLREALQGQGFNLIATFDNAIVSTPPFTDVPLFVGKEGFAAWRASSPVADICALVAVGGDRGRDRLELQHFMAAQGLPPLTVVHPSAFVACTASLGSGCQVLAQSAVCVDAKLGAACIVNTSASVDHECVLGQGVHIAPGAHLAGCVEVGDFTLVAVGAVVLPRIRIGRDCIIGAGAVVTRNVPDSSVVYGNPARVVRNNFKKP